MPKPFCFRVDPSADLADCLTAFYQAFDPEDPPAGSPAREESWTLFSLADATQREGPEADGPAPPPPGIGSTPRTWLPASPAEIKGAFTTSTKPRPAREGPWYPRTPLDRAACAAALREVLRFLEEVMTPDPGAEGKSDASGRILTIPEQLRAAARQMGEEDEAKGIGKKGRRKVAPLYLTLIADWWAEGKGRVQGPVHSIKIPFDDEVAPICHHKPGVKLESARRRTIPEVQLELSKRDIPLAIDLISGHLTAELIPGVQGGRDRT
jgi:hypothetical protein